MSERMVEAVALAIWSAREMSFPPRVRRGPDAVDRQTGTWAIVMNQSRAALEAMREPTEAMTKILAASIGSQREAQLAYRAMIDEALR